MQRDPRTNGTRAHLQRSLSRLIRTDDSSLLQLRAVPFWLTVCVPWVILLLTLTGVASARPNLLASLVGLTFVSAVLGHGYSQR